MPGTRGAANAHPGAAHPGAANEYAHPGAANKFAHSGAASECYIVNSTSKIKMSLKFSLQQNIIYIVWELSLI